MLSVWYQIGMLGVWYQIGLLGVWYQIGMLGVWYQIGLLGVWYQIGLLGVWYPSVTFAGAEAGNCLVSPNWWFRKDWGRARNGTRFC